MPYQPPTEETTEEVPEVKSKKLVHVDGFTFTQEEWDEIKDGYIPPEPTQYEIEIGQICKSYIVSALNAIDQMIMIEDYQAQASPAWLKKKAYDFLNLDLTKHAANNDLVVLEQFLEVMCGLPKEDHQNYVSDIIDTTIDAVENKWKETYH